MDTHISYNPVLLQSLLNLLTKASAKQKFNCHFTLALRPLQLRLFVCDKRPYFYVSVNRHSSLHLQQNLEIFQIIQEQHTVCNTEHLIVWNLPLEGVCKDVYIFYTFRLLNVHMVKLRFGVD